MATMTENLQYQKVLITGGATRIGAEIAKSIAGRKNKITIHYNRSGNKAKKLKKILEKKGSEVFLVKANLNNISELNKILPFANKKMKGISCLINNASIFENDNIKKAIKADKKEQKIAELDLSLIRGVGGLVLNN